MYREHGVSTEWLLKNFGSEYKVIFVGDALMDMYELTEKRYSRRATAAIGVRATATSRGSLICTR